MSRHPAGGGQWRKDGGIVCRNVKISKVCYFHSAKIKRYCDVTSHFLWFLNMVLSNMFNYQRKLLVINRKYNVEYTIYFTRNFHSCFALDNILKLFYPVVMWLKHWRLSNQSIKFINTPIYLVKKKSIFNV